MAAAPRSASFPRCHVLATFVLAVSAGACRVVSETAKAPGKVVDAILPSKDQKKPVDPERVQSQVMRLADEVIARTNGALDGFEGSDAATPEQVLRWRLANAQAAISVTTRPNPALALADLLSMTTLTRMALERKVGEEPGSPYEGWLTVSKDLETETWNLARELAGDEICDRASKQIQGYFAQDTGVADDALDHPQQLMLDAPTASKDGGTGGGLLSIIGLDPFAGLDPAVKEIAQARLLGERATFAFQRMVQVVHWQAELLVLQVLQQQQVETLVANTTRATEQVERAVAVAEGLPGQVATMLEESAGPLHDVSDELARTLDSGTEMSKALDTTLHTFDGLMARFGVGEEDATSPDATTPAAEPPADAGKPFDILDYAHTADSLAEASRELNTLLGSLNGTLDSPAWEARLADVEQLSDRARDDAQQLLDRAFLLGAALIGIAVTAAVLYRLAARRWLGARTDGGHP